MKTLKVLGFIVTLVVLFIVGYIFYLQPDYSGELQFPGLYEEVDVYYDNYGVPNIYASTEEDAYRALGYVHAKDRLFQMEMLRRVGGGRLSEILGKDLVETDKFFRTIGIDKSADSAVKKYFSSNRQQSFQKAALAYLEGINHFIENGKTPLEYTLLGIRKEKFTPKDMYLVTGYMAYSFAIALRTDPTVEKIKQQLGSAYLKDIAYDWPKGFESVPVQQKDSLAASISSAFHSVSDIFNKTAMPPWIGSNSWVLSGKKTKSGKPLLCNDTHIGYGQPSVWYEAHIEYPGYQLYGNYMAGFPFQIIGHNQFAAIGMTMFENDDIDLYVEKVNPDNSNEVFFKDHWEKISSREEIIKIKGEKDTVVTIQETRHGAIINGSLKMLDELTDQPVSFWWEYNQSTSTILESSYKLSHAVSIDQARNAVSMITAPGLNIMYADKLGNIAWWAAARLPKRPEHVNSITLLDGSSGKDEILGYYDFSENPQNENPESGFLYSANNSPDSVHGVMHAGYYAPDYRAKRILSWFSQEKKWEAEDMKTILRDVVNTDNPQYANEILSVIGEENYSASTETAEILKEWKGDNQVTDIAPVIWTKLWYTTMKLAMEDELGKETFADFVGTHLFKCTYPNLLYNDSSLWWDNINTKEKETRKDIFSEAFDNTVESLKKQLGNKVENWQWGKVHRLEHIHPIGRKQPFNLLFNVGPFEAQGTSEVVNNSSFVLNEEGVYKVKYGPAMRRIIDFSDLENTLSILPTGQSGNVFSNHYNDQAEMYLKGEFRKQMMNEQEIKNSSKNKFVLKLVQR